MKKHVATVTIEGTSILMHNGQLADPSNPYAKELKGLTGNRKKGDSDRDDIAKVEYMGGLYFDEKEGPYLPCDMLEAMIVEGSKRRRKGKELKAVLRVVDEVNPLKYEGPRTREALWADRKFRDVHGIKIQKVRVMRTRPKFTNWSCTFQVSLLDGETTLKDVEDILTDAGVYIGVGDWRPKFGQFNVASFVKAK